MRAAEHENIGPCSEEGFQDVGYCDLDLGAIQDSALHELHKARTGTSDHTYPLRMGADEFVELLSRERGLCREHADDSTARMFCGGLDPWLHPHDGQRVFCTQCSDSIDGRRVARDHENLRPVMQQIICNRKDPATDQLRTLRSVRTPRRVTHIVDVCVREQAMDLSQDGQSTDARIKKAYFHQSKFTFYQANGIRWALQPVD